MILKYRFSEKIILTVPRLLAALSPAWRVRAAVPPVTQFEFGMGGQCGNAGAA